MKTIICISMFCFFTYPLCDGQTLQSTVITSGAEIYNFDGGSISWCVGEWMTETHESGLVLEQGFLHAFLRPRDNMTTAVADYSMERGVVWPNPAHVSFQIKTDMVAPAEVLLLDGHGRICHQWKLKSANEHFSVETIPSGHYYVVVRREGLPGMYVPISIIH